MLLVPSIHRALAPAAVLLLGGLALAQVPKVGRHYERPDLGFRVKTPADWDLVPPQPGDPHMLVKFDPPNTKYVETGPGYGDRVFLSCWLVQFDRRPKDESEKSRFTRKPLKDVVEWVQKAGEVEEGSKHKLDGKKELNVGGKVPAIEYVLTTPGEEKTSKRVYAMQYALAPDLDVAIVFTAPGAKSKWPKYENVFEQMAKSLLRLELSAAGAGPGADAPLREREREKLQKSLAALGGGWKLHETPNYFVVTPHTDRAFVTELCDRLEAIRAVYEVDYPYEKAKELREAGAAAQTGLSEAEKKKKELEKKAMDELFGGADSRELSRCSVVRVFTDRENYHSYGGPPGSAGYWSAFHRELVLYDDQAGGGRNDTWIVLNHEAFHQYIFYLYGNISPHSWYNEGTGDFYSGLEYKNKRFTLKPNLWRRDTIKAAVQQGKHVPLADFVRWSQAEYYGNNKLGVDGGQNYAQGWSFIYFLRTGKKNFPKGWDASWDGILDTYFRVLAMSSDLDQAVSEAFQGIDMEKLQKAWEASTK
ncbi:MAG: hypothetical protein JNK02_09570 [Planctomycetes bacterium]|nr:hypothetical protein [Planctomycetota bacterium]